ncbi:MAG: Gfo/Idh/MocA family protein [Micrococcales bacterium]
MTNLKWAMVGSGFMAQLILKDFALADNTELYALVSRDPERGKARLDELGVSAKAMTFEEALADDQIDVIYVATPHSEHFPMAKAALNAGKHVLVEKAFTLNADEARELAALAKEKQRFLMEAMWTKFLPAMIALKEIIASGELGNVVGIEADFGFNAPFDNNHRLFNFELGGGTTLDQGVYTTTFVTWMANSKIKSMSVVGKRFSNGADSHADTTFVFENGIIGHGISSLISTYGGTARVIGSEKSVTVLGSFWSATELEIVTFQREGDPLREHRSYETKGAGYAHMLGAVSTAILEGKLETDQHPNSAAIETMEILDTIRAAIA